MWVPVGGKLLPLSVLQLQPLCRFTFSSILQPLRHDKNHLAQIISRSPNVAFGLKMDALGVALLVSAFLAVAKSQTCTTFYTGQCPGSSSCLCTYNEPCGTMQYGGQTSCNSELGGSCQQVLGILEGTSTFFVFNTVKAFEPTRMYAAGLDGPMPRRCYLLDKHRRLLRPASSLFIYVGPGCQQLSR